LNKNRLAADGILLAAEEIHHFLNTSLFIVIGYRHFLIAKPFHGCDPLDVPEDRTYPLVTASRQATGDVEADDPLSGIGRRRRCPKRCDHHQPYGACQKPLYRYLSFHFFLPGLNDRFISYALRYRIYATV